MSLSFRRVSVNILFVSIDNICSFFIANACHRLYPVSQPDRPSLWPILSSEHKTGHTKSRTLMRYLIFSLQTFTCIYWHLLLSISVSTRNDRVQKLLKLCPLINTRSCLERSFLGKTILSRSRFCFVKKEYQFESSPEYFPRSQQRKMFYPIKVINV